MLRAMRRLGVRQGGCIAVHPVRHPHQQDQHAQQEQMRSTRHGHILDHWPGARVTCRGMTASGDGRAWEAAAVQFALVHTLPPSRRAGRPGTGENP